MGNVAEKFNLRKRDKKEVVGASKFSYTWKARILLKSVGNGIKNLREGDRDTKDVGPSFIAAFLFRVNGVM